MKKTEFMKLKPGDYLWTPNHRIVEVVYCHQDIDLNETPPKKYVWAIEVSDGRQIRLFDNLTMWGNANRYVQSKKKNLLIEEWVKQWVNSLTDEQVEDAWFRITMSMFAHKNDTWADVKDEVNRAEKSSENLRGRLMTLLADWLEVDGPAVTYYGYIR